MTAREISICKRIKELRKEIGLNQTEFGKQIEVAQGYLTNIETAKRPATEKILKLILLQSWNGKKVNEEWLINGTGDMFIILPDEDETAALVYNLLKPDKNELYEIILEIVRTYEELSPASQQVIRESCEKLITNLQKIRRD